MPLNIRRSRIIEADCHNCVGPNPSCQKCYGTGVVTKRACQRCGGIGNEGGAKCFDCRGDGFRDLDQDDYHDS